jgi:hypothetical protein
MPEFARALMNLLEKYQRDGRSTSGEPQKNDAPFAARGEKPKTPIKTLSE